MAKLITLGANRDEAIARMRRALDMFVVEGIYTSIPLHQKILAHPDFIAGKIDTGFLARSGLAAGEEVGRYNRGRMEISLNPELQARIEEKLRNGEFSSADALVEQALTLFLESEGDEMDAAEFSATRSAVEQGLE